MSDKKFLAVIVLTILGLAAFFSFMLLPGGELNDYRLELSYIDGKVETYNLDSVSYFRCEHTRSNDIVRYDRYHNGKNEMYGMNNVVRYKLYTKRTYKNDTASYKRHKFVLYSILISMIIPIVYIRKNKWS